MQVESDVIVEYVGETFAERGERYFEEGRIVSPRIDGRELRAECYGSRREPYRVKARLDENGVAASSCSCPVRGPCKHVAALLYAFARNRSQFADPGRLRDRLREQSRDELVELIVELGNRFRDVERYLERRLLERASGEAPDVEEIRRHAEDAFESAFERAAGRGFDEVIEAVVEDLERLAAVGARRRDGGRPGEALDVWAPLVDVSVEHDFEAGRGLDAMFAFLVDLEEELVELLEALDSAERRGRAFDVLWRLFELDLEHGGVGLARPFWAALRERADEDEVSELVGRAERRLDRERESGWPDQRTGRLLWYVVDEFGAEDRGLDERLRDLEELGAVRDVVATLLDEGREEEARQRVREVESSQTFVGALEPFLDEKLQDAAEELARERIRERGHDHTVQAWLVDELVDRDRDAEALELAVTMLEEHPNREAFDRVRLLADALGRWDDLRDDALGTLREEAPRAYLQYAMENGTIDDSAVEVWEEAFASESRDSWRASDLELEFAESAVDDHPEVAVRIWVREIEALLESGASDDYRRAADLLDRVAAALERRGDDERWDDIRERFVERAGDDRDWRRALDRAGILA